MTRVFARSLTRLLARHAARGTVRTVSMFAMLTILPIATACSGRDSNRSAADAARADSSAAGYTVGRAADGAADASGVNGGLPAASTGLPGATPVGSAPAPTVPRAAVPATAQTTTRATGTTSNTSSGHGVAVRADTSAASTSGKRAPNAVAGRAPAESTAAAPVVRGPVRVNEFLTYDSGSKIVSLQLIAGYNGLNGSLNYNGATNGLHGILVPTGWRIHIAVTNRDSDLQHSAIVLKELLPPPVEPSEPAFAGATLPQLAEGLHQDETSSLDFVADRPGHYMIACNVPGHAQAGMWLKLSVAGELTVPAYR